MKPHNPAKLNPLIYEQACEWFVEFRTSEPDEAARRAFHAWLQESPAHMGAYLHVTADWNQSASNDIRQRWPVDELVAQAARDSDVVVAYPGAPMAAVDGSAAVTDALSRGSPKLSERFTPGARRFALAACVAASLAGAGLITWLNSDPSYSTAIGEQRSMALRDGSIVTLNSRSKIRMRYTAHERGVDLLEGQALFTVAKDPARPFIVRTDATQVQAVGTEFDVYRKASGIVVTVVEGRVAVSAPEANATSAGTDHSGSALPETPSAGNPIARSPEKSPDVQKAPHVAAIQLLSAGEQVVLTPKISPQPVLVNVAAATAWTQRRLVFAATSLRTVADEFNRYNERQFVIRDRSLESFEIDGVFSSTDPSSLIRFLRERPEMQVTETGTEIVIAHR
jgi:transmembrane sensor